MDGGHRYEINLKKEDLFINLSSDDVYFISKQMDKWCRVMLDDAYVPISINRTPMPQQAAPGYQNSQPAAPGYQDNQPAQTYQNPQPVPQPQAYAQPPAETYQQPVPQPAPQQVQLPPIYEQSQPQPQPAPTPVEYQQPQFQQPMHELHPQPIPAQPVPQPHPMAAQAAPLPAPQPVHQAPLADVQLPLAQPQPQPQPVTAAVREPLPPLPAIQPEIAQSAVAPAMDPVVEDDFEAVMDSLMKDLEDDGPAASPVAPASANGNGNGNGHHASPEPQMVGSLSDLCDRSHAGSSEDYLLLSAYYLTQFERQDKFSLKRVNSTLVKSGLTPVNHSVLETTLTRGYLSMVPDLTGMADVSEYVLTADGQMAASRLL